MTLALTSVAATFAQLWKVAQTEASRQNTTPSAVFQSVGLRLEVPEKPWQYYCTPKNTRTFASTGRDGVHYSFLEVRSLHYSPIVMTVPMSFDNPNIVVAETLHEFLCLGCRASYLSLEMLSVCGGDFSSLKSKSYAAGLSQAQQHSLQVLSDSFSLFPYVALEWRMAQLQAKYLDFLQMGEVVQIHRRADSKVMNKAKTPAAFAFGQFT
ncbi:MAG: hypothetical protein AAFQ63_15835 [Cyanobacteria bacterium J06621_11]